MGILTFDAQIHCHTVCNTTFLQAHSRYLNSNITDANMKKKVMIVEDNEEMQVLYHAVFKKEPNIQLIAQEDSAENAIKKIPDIKPDLIILDVSLPGMDGIELTAFIHSHFPQIKILVVTAYETERFLSKAKEAGADNLITKTSAFEVLNEARKLLRLT